jgi:hypothetical protein
VHLGLKDLDLGALSIAEHWLYPPLAQHWAVRVGGQRWIEIAGAGKNANNAPNVIEETTDDCSKVGVCDSHSWPGYYTLVGSTLKSDAEIAEW